MRVKKTRKVDIVIVCVLAALLALAVVLTLIPSAKQREIAQKAASYEAFIGKKIGILTGTNMEAETFRYFPKSEYLYFDGYPNMNIALKSGVIDAYLGDEPALKSIHAAEPDINYFHERLTNNRYSFAFRKDDPEEKALRDQFNQFLAKIKANGVYDEIDRTWFGVDESKKVVDMSDLTGENGTIHVVTTSTDEPFSYIKDGKNVGYDIDVAVRFCREYGYAIEIGEVDFSARIPALASGKYEFTTTMNVTPEREEEVLFSDPVSEGGIVVAARSDEIIAGEPSYTEYIGKRIGMVTGFSLENIVLELFPDSTYVYQESDSDLVLAMKSGSIDCYAGDLPTIRGICAEEPELGYLSKPLYVEGYSFAFSKASDRSEKILREFNAFVEGLRESGELTRLQDTWSEDAQRAEQAFDPTVPKGKNGTITVALLPDRPPFTYVSNGAYTGFAVELITLFAREYDYAIAYETGTLSSCIAGMSSGKYDVLIGSISVTEERKASMLFSDTVYEGGLGLSVPAIDLGVVVKDERNIFQKIASSFEKNFLRESRWKLIAQGVGTTCFITVLSVLFGTVLAFLICMFRRTGSKLANTISNLYVKLLQGTPTVVLLMLLYYVVFAKTPFSAITVAIIGFTLNFGAYASEIMRSGIESIDPGQREAALALGFTENQSFFRFIFPQAAQRFLPVYRGEIVSLLKSTSIVGYIAVQDLTKMSDIIRARTYEAFFPLIATALIYFFLAWIITLILGRVLKGVDPKHRRAAKGGTAK